MNMKNLDKLHDKLTALGFVKYGWIHYHEPSLLIYHFKEVEPDYMKKEILMMVISPEEGGAVLRSSTNVESMVKCVFPEWE